MAVSSFTSSGSKSTAAIALPKDIFAVEVDNHELLKQTYVAHKANGRINLAKALKRGEVSGGGKKPWRQKGTGNARTGSIRNPIWRGGGITFGPEGNENYSKKVNTKANKQAIKQALSLAAKNGRLATIDKFAVSSGKTADAAKLVNKMALGTKVTVVADKFDDKTLSAVSNLNEVKIVLANRLSVADVLDAKNLVVTKDAVAALASRLGGKQ